MGAVLSDCGAYRYQLRRYIHQPVRWVKPGAFVMLNPSTADATEDDPTIRRCMGFAERFGWTDLIVLNLFALRATDPKELRNHRDPIGPSNDAFLQGLRHDAPVVAAWGAHPMATEERVDDVLNLLNRPIYCLGTTKAGAPRHPLYLPKDAELRLWRGAETAETVEPKGEES